jgi:hypothetical protein
MTHGLGQGVDLDALIGRELVLALGRRLAEVELTIARLMDEEAKGNWKASVDLRYEYSRKEKLELWMERAQKQRRP